MRTLLHHLGQLPVEQRVGKASRAQTDEAAQRPRTCPYTYTPRKASHNVTIDPPWSETSGTGYPTDLSDAEWSLLQPLIPPPKPGGRPRETDMRAVLNAARYVHDRGGGWRRLPLSFPPWQTVYCYVREWKRDGTWEAMLSKLRELEFTA